MCVGCDLPAGRKACGFLSYTANLGCSRCYCNFGTGIVGKRDYSGFDRDNWSLRSNEKHRDDVKSTLTCSSKSAREKKESEVGCRYSCLLQLPYFDAVRMLIIDPICTIFTWVQRCVDEEKHPHLQKIKYWHGLFLLK